MRQRPAVSPHEGAAATYRPRLHVLYEHGPDPRPFASSYIRLIRPLTHPLARALADVSFGLAYDGAPVDAVILDRLWRPDVTQSMLDGLIADVRRAGARLIYSLDDDLLAVGSQAKLAETLLREADGVLVTTERLRERCLPLNPRVEVLPNVLDERLLVPRSLPPAPRRRMVIGYMGTLTHDDDLLMVLPALEAICTRHANVSIELIGAVVREETLARLANLPLRVLRAKVQETEYPLFMPWLTGRVRWDIGIAPLRNTALNRCKSDLKFLDYGAMGAAGVFSDAAPYAATVRHGETGLLAGDGVAAWTEALDALLDDPALRARLAVNARRYLARERTLLTCAPQWPNAIGRLLSAS